MSHFFTDEQELLRESVRQFVDDEVRPRALELDEAEEFPKDLYQRCVELGLVGLTAPEEFGGIPNGLSTFLMVMEEIGHVLPNLALGLEVNEFAISAVSCGTEEQRQKYLPGLLNGSQYGGVFCTDPAGSVNHPEWAMHAVKVEGGYLLNAPKVMVSYRHAATMCVIQAKSENGIQLFIVPDVQNKPEVEIGGDYIKLGMRGSETGDVTVTDLFIPEADAIPVGPLPVDIWLNMAAIALGSAEEAFAKTFEFQKNRTKAHKPIYTLGGNGRAFAEFATDLELARNMLYNTAALIEQGNVDPFQTMKMACMCKAWIVRMAIHWLDESIEMNGSVGYIEEYGLARLLRDAHGLRLAEYSERMVQAIIEQCLGIPDVIV